MSDFLKNAPKKALSDTAKQQWDLDTSPADIPDDIVEWRRTHKQKKAAVSVSGAVPVKPVKAISLVKTNDTEVSAKIDSQPDSDLDRQLDSQISANVDAKVNAELSVKSALPVKESVEVDARIDSQPDSDLDRQLDSQISAKIDSQSALASSHLGNWQRILDQGDKSILEFLWINRQTEIETRILSFEELSSYSKTPYGTVRYKLRRLRALALINDWQRGAIGKLKGNIYRLNRENIAQAIPLLVQEDVRGRSGRGRNVDSQLDRQINSQADGLPPCSSSILNTTTTGEGSAKNFAAERTAIVERLRQEIIFAEWEGLDVASLVRYIFQDGKWIHSMSELQDFLDKAAAAVEYSKKTKSPISSALGFLHSCLAKWSVDTPPGYESRQERALRFRLEEEKKRLENLKRLNQELAVTRFKTFVAEQKPEKIKELREAAEKAGKIAPVGGKRVERHHYVSSLVDLFFEKEIIEGITKDALLDVPDLI